MGLAMVFVASCSGTQEEDSPVSIENKIVKFTISPQTVSKDQADIVVSHNGSASDTWYGFVTEDLTTRPSVLIISQREKVSPSTLHIGAKQTVRIKGLNPEKDYRYIVFGVTTDARLYGEAASFIFTTDEDFDIVEFEASVESVEAHEVTLAVSHNGKSKYTWNAFITEDLTTEASALMGEYVSDYARKHPDAPVPALGYGLSGKQIFTGLERTTDYRVIVYGQKENGAVYGTPAEVMFTTTEDYEKIKFNVESTHVGMTDASVKVSYTSKETLSWYGFLSDDMTAKTADLIAAKTAGVTNWETDAEKEITLTGLLDEHDYRYIVTGLRADGTYGVPGELRFKTISAAYVNCVFTVTAPEIKGCEVKINVQHTGKDGFEYYGFITTDLTSSLDDLAAAVTTEVDSKLRTGKNLTYVVNDLDPGTEYRYIVVGRFNGVNYGHPGELRFTTAATVDFAKDNNWKLVWEGTDRVLDSAAPEIITNNVADATVSGKYRFVLATFSVDDYLDTMDDFVKNSIAPWAVSNNSSQIAQGATLDEILKEASATEHFEFFDYGEDYTIFAVGINSNNIATGHYNFLQIHKDDPALKANYNDFIGDWELGSATISITAKANGSTYNIEGIPSVRSFSPAVSGVIEGVYTSDGKLTVSEQIYGSWDALSTIGNDYGMCDDYLFARFTAGGTAYRNWFANSDNPAVIFTIAKLPGNQWEFRPGKNDELGFTFDGFWSRWQIREGENAGLGNNYGQADFPVTFNKAPDAEPEYLAWLGAWNDGTNTYTIVRGKTNESFIINGFWSSFIAPVDYNTQTGGIIWKQRETGETVENTAGDVFDIYTSGFNANNNLYPNATNLAYWEMNGSSVAITCEDGLDLTILKLLAKNKSTGGWANFNGTVELSVEGGLTKGAASGAPVAAPARTLTLGTKETGYMVVPTYNPSYKAVSESRKAPKIVKKRQQAFNR